jgi:hypothetical protein
VGFTIRVVIVAVRAIRCGQTIRLSRVTGAKSTKHDIQYKRERGDENARSSQAVPKCPHLLRPDNTLVIEIIHRE